jgi:3-dehydroquinate dehydratase
MINIDSLPRPLFSQQKLPLLVASLSDPTPTKAICTMRNAIFDGAEAFMIHLEAMKQEHLCEKDLKTIINYACDKPMFTMNYRLPNGKSDEQLVDEQIMAVRAGASMIDMMGDMFEPSPRELSQDSRSIDRQRQVIEEVHALGGEVLMSSHIWEYMPVEQTLAHAKALEARGGDFVKIAMCIHNEEQMIESLRATVLVKNELKVPFLHICMGQWGKLLRAVSPMFGSCFALCVQSYTEAGHKEKPLLRAEKAVLENIDWMRARDPLSGTRVPRVV